MHHQMQARNKPTKTIYLLPILLFKVQAFDSSPSPASVLVFEGSAVVSSSHADPATDAGTTTEPSLLLVLVRSLSPGLGALGRCDRER
jgi:hypothetical protein